MLARLLCSAFAFLAKSFACASVCLLSLSERASERFLVFGGREMFLHAFSSFWILKSFFLMILSERGKRCKKKRFERL